jgi:peptide/nickel transport system substrate-binding protein
MRIGVGAPPEGIANTGVRVMVSHLKGETWLTSKPDGTVAERIATSWSWDSSATVLRLRLRNDVYFHDGTLLTPAVAADALRETLGGSVASIGVEAADTVVITLREPNAFLLPDLAGQSLFKPGSKDAVGTGAYKVASTTEKGASLVAFPQYYRGKPAMAGIDVINYPTQRSAWTAMMRGEIDMLYEVSRDSTEFVQADTRVRSYPFSHPYYIPLVFNVRHPILRKAEVRQAINQALDRTALVKEGLRGQGSVAEGPLWPKHWAYKPTAYPHLFDPLAAGKRLDAAGFSARPSAKSGVPLRFTFKCLVFGNDPRFERLAVVAQKQLADIGIDMQLESLPLNALAERARSGDFDAFLIEMSGRSPSRLYDYWRSRERAPNNSGYRGADAVLDRLRAARTDDETRAAVADLQRVLHDDPPAVFIAWQQMIRAVSADFDVAAEPDRDILSNVRLWRRASPPPRASR